MHYTKDDFPTWKTVTLGLFQNGEAYISSILDKETRIGKVAQALGRKLEINKSIEEVELIKLSTEDLELPNDTPLIEIYPHVLELGLGLCRPEVGFALRDQYTNQPKGEVLWIGMKTTSIGRENGGLALSHENRGKWLTFGCGGPDCWWGVWRRKHFSPKQQEMLVPMYLCECPWSRRGDKPITVIFEKKSCNNKLC